MLPKAWKRGKRKAKGEGEAKVGKNAAEKRERRGDSGVCAGMQATEQLVNEAGFETAIAMPWSPTAEHFVLFCRMAFGMGLDGPPPYWHFVQLCNEVRNGG